MSESYFKTIAGPLGRVLIEFNGLEMDAGRVIARLVREENFVAAAFAGAMGFSQKIALIETLVALKVKNPDLQAEFAALVKRAYKINSERNRLIHAEYFVLLNEHDEFQGTLHRKLRDAAKNAIKGRRARKGNGCNSKITRGACRRN